MTSMNMVLVELNETKNNTKKYKYNDNICVQIINISIININDVTTLHSCKIHCKMTMPRKLVWMDVKFM